MNQTKEDFVPINKEHKELIIALITGFLTLLAWRMDVSDQMTAAIITYMYALIIGGYSIAKQAIQDMIINKSFNINIFMIMAAVSCSLIGYWIESALFILILTISRVLKAYMIEKSNKELSSLLSLQPEEAALVRGGFDPFPIPTSSLQINDHILVKPGERIPADGVIFKGSSLIEEVVITSEARPVTKNKGDQVFAGTLNISEALTINVTKTKADSLFQKMSTLLQTAQNIKTPLQQFIERFEKIYIMIIILIATLILFVSHYALDWEWNHSIYRAIILLVVASPCAILVSTIPATLATISNGARNGLVIKSNNHLAQLSKIQALVVNQTDPSILTHSYVTDVLIRVNEDKKQVLAIIAAISSQSNHSLAQEITQYATKQNNKSVDAKIESQTTFGIKANVSNQTYFMGNADFVGYDLAEKFTIDASYPFINPGKTTVYLKDHQGIIARIALQNTVKEDTKKSITTLQKLGVHVFLLTDSKNKENTNTLAIQSGYEAICAPNQRGNKIKEFLKKYHNVAIVGDTINDMTTMIHIAFARSSASDTADIVLMKNDLSKIAYAMKLGHTMQKVMKQNLFISFTAIILLVVLNVFQLITLPLAVIGHEASIILVILNSLRCLRIIH